MKLPKKLLTDALPECLCDVCMQGDLEFFETCPGGEPGLRERLKNVLQNDFVRMTYTELVDLVRKDAKEGKVSSVPRTTVFGMLLSRLFSWVVLGGNGFPEVIPW